MSNPYMDRITERMRRDDAVGQLHRHWSARAEKRIHRVGFLLEKWGFDRLSHLWCRITSPVEEWLGRHQARFLSRWL
jgi:hypothetical protein